MAHQTHASGSSREREGGKGGGQRGLQLYLQYLLGKKANMRKCYQFSIIGENTGVFLLFYVFFSHFNMVIILKRKNFLKK